MAEKDEIEQRLKKNLDRVARLSATYVHLGTGKQGRRSAADADVLRAAAVLLHATLEDFIRSIERWKLPSVTDHAILDKVPFAGSKNVRADKVPLGHLLQFKGRSVDELLIESIQEHLGRVSYNDVTDILGHLIPLGVDKAQITCDFAVISELIGRRHKIVHEADQTDAGRQGKHRVRSIGTWHLVRWTDAVKLFCEEVLKQL